MHFLHYTYFELYRVVEGVVHVTVEKSRLLIEGQLHRSAGHDWTGKDRRRMKSRKVLAAAASLSRRSQCSFNTEGKTSA